MANDNYWSKHPGRRLSRRALLHLGAAGAVGLSSASLLAACGGSNNNASSAKATVASGGGAASQATARGTVASAPSTAASSVAGTPRATSTPASGTVSYYSGETADNEVAWYTNVINPAVKKANPDITIQGQYLDVGKDYFPKLQTALAAHNPPDFLPRNGLPTAYTLWSQGVVDPVDDIVQTIGGDKFFPTVLESMKVGNNYLGAPLDVNCEVFFYRTDLAQQAGLKPPTNWAELLTFAKTLTQGSVYGLVTPSGRNAATNRMFFRFLRQNGGNIVDPDLKVVFDSPAVVEALDFIKEVSQYSPPGSGNYSYGEVRDAFYTGRAAAVITNGRVAQEFSSKNPGLADKLGAVQAPYSKEPFNYASWSVAQVFKEAKRKDLAKLWITKFEFDPQIAAQWINIAPGFTFSSMPAVEQLPDYINNPVRQKYPDIIKQLSIAAKAGGEYTKESPKHKLNPHAGELDGGTILADVVQNVLVGGQSSKSAVQAGGKLIEALMKG